MDVTAYGSVKNLRLNDTTITATIEVELERGLVDDLMDLKRRGQLKLVFEPFQKRLGEDVMKEIREFAERHPYVRVDVPPGCVHEPGMRAWRYYADQHEGFEICGECAQVLGPCPHLQTTMQDEKPETEVCDACGKPIGELRASQPTGVPPVPDGMLAHVFRVAVLGDRCDICYQEEAHDLHSDGAIRQARGPAVEPHVFRPAWGEEAICLFCRRSEEDDVHTKTAEVSDDEAPPTNGLKPDGPLARRRRASAGN